MIGRSAVVTFVAVVQEHFGRVLRIPWLGRFICPLAVAGLGLRYLETPFAVRLEQLFRYLRQVALRRVDILGLQRDWCAKQILFPLVHIVCVKKVICMERLAWALVNSGAAGDIAFLTWWEVMPFEPNGRVQRSVAGSFPLLKIVLPLYLTVHLHCQMLRCTLHL